MAQSDWSKTSRIPPAINQTCIFKQEISHFNYSIGLFGRNFYDSPLREAESEDAPEDLQVSFVTCSRKVSNLNCLAYGTLRN